MKSNPIRVIKKFAEKFPYAGEPTQLVVAIDPGSSGAIALVGEGSNNETFYTVLDIPTVKIKRGRGNQTVYDQSMILKVFRLIEGMIAREMYAVVEQPPPKGASPYGQFRLGVNYALWPLFLKRCGFKVREVSPQGWKIRMGLTRKSKDHSLAKGRKNFPKAELHLKRHHDRAEALLLAKWFKEWGMFA